MAQPVSRAWALAVLVLVGAAGSAGAQPRAVGTPGAMSWVVGGWWRQAQGLPQDRVTMLTQTRDGYLWVGTRNGVGRFDGLRFTTWPAGTPDGPPEGEVYAIAEHPNGDLWIPFYGGGLTRYRAGRFTTWDTNNGLADNYARAVAVAADGAVWVGTDRGLSRLFDGQFSHYHSAGGPADNAIRALLVDRDGTVFAGTERGLSRVVGQSLVHVPLPAGADQASVEALYGDRFGRLWVSTSNGLAILDESGAIVVGRANGLASESIRYVTEDAAGRIWVATMAGVDCALPGPSGALQFVPVIVGGDAATVFEDREHSIWVGFRGFGVARLQRALFDVWNASRGLPSDSTTTVFRAGNGTMWVGTGTGVAAITGTRVTTFGVQAGLPNRAVSSIAEDTDGRLWLGTESGLYRSTTAVTCPAGRCAATFLPVGGHPGLREHIRVIRIDPQAALIGTNSSGVLSVPLRGGTPVTVIAEGEVRAIVRQTPDRLWIGTRDRGLTLVTPAASTRYTTAEGLPHITVQSLHAGSDGTLWIGTRRGLAWLRDGRLASVTSAQGLPQNHVYGVLSDRTGRVWLSSGSGVSVIAAQDLFEVAAGRRATLSPTEFGTEHGLPSTLCALSHDPVVTTDAHGRVWVATLGGAVSIDPADAVTRPVAPVTVVELARVESNTVFPGEPAEYLHERGTLTFEFVAPTFVAPSRTRYRYRLVGYDQSWIDGGSATEARFTNLSPGRYRFEVVADHDRRGPGPEPTRFAVYLVPRVYQRAWFQALAGVLAIGLVTAIGLTLHRIRVKRLQDHERELARRVDEALVQIKTLRGLLPVCAWCHRVRDDAGYWTQMEAYVREHSQAEFSHSLCPDCLKSNFPDDAAALEPPAESPKP